MFSEFLCGLVFALIGFSKLHDFKTAINDSFLVDAYAELEVVEIEAPLKPVLHGTIVRITSKDKLCHLRMSDKKYPVKWGRGSVYFIYDGLQARE